MRRHGCVSPKRTGHSPLEALAAPGAALLGVLPKLVNLLVGHRLPDEVDVGAPAGLGFEAKGNVLSV